MIQGQLLAYAVLTLAERGDPPSHRRHMLTDGQVEALDEGRIDLPAMCRQHLLDRTEGAEDDAVLHVDQTPAPHRLDHLSIEQLGLRHPARLGRWACGLTACRLHPLPIVRQEGCHILLEAISE